MRKLGELMVKHPDAAMIALSAVMAYAVSRVYRIGLLTGQVRELVSAEARAASDALGG